MKDQLKSIQVVYAVIAIIVVMCLLIGYFWEEFA